MVWKPDYVELEALKSYLRVDDSSDDALFALYITTASRAVDDYCGRQFGATEDPETRTFTTKWDRQRRAYVAQIDDLMDLTGVAVTAAGAALVADDDYQLEPANAPARGKPYERLVTDRSGLLAIAADVWGWSSGIPASVQTGTLLQASRLEARRDSPFGVAGSPSEGSELRLLAALDPDLQTSLRPLKRSWWAA